MATDIRSMLAFISNDADMRTWGAAIHAQLLAAGLTVASDTGQIDHTTSVRPGISSFNSKAGGTNGYEIWRFSDTLQATVPVFIKVEYGIGAAADRPNLAFTVGTGTDGAGTITGQVGTRRANPAGASKTAAAVLNSYCSGGSGRISLCTNLDPANSAFAIFLNVERPKNSAGVDQADGVITGCGIGASTVQFQNIPASGTLPSQAANNLWGFLLAAAGQNSSLGGNVALLPLIALFGKVLYGTPCLYKHTDLGELVSFSATHFGASHTFLPLGDGFVGSTAESGTSVALLWE